MGGGGPPGSPAVRTLDRRLVELLKTHWDRYETPMKALGATSDEQAFVLSYGALCQAGVAMVADSLSLTGIVVHGRTAQSAATVPPRSIHLEQSMGHRRPTVHDVARAAGVSAMSVSRVLNGRPGVGRDTARRIEDAIRALGFRPNKLATRLRHQRRLSLLGMIVPDPYTPLFTSIAVAVDELVRDDGLVVVTASFGRDIARERALVASFIERGVDGILLFSEDSDHRYLEPELDRGYPVVFLGSPPVGVTAPAVLVDNRGGAREAVEHLLRHDHRRIGIITSATGFPASERLVGYEETLAHHGIPVDTNLIQRTEHTPDQGQLAAECLLALPAPPTAIFSTNYLLTAGALRALRDHQRSIALIGFDDFDAASMVDPPITVMTQDPPVMGRHAARMLLDQLAGRGDRATRVIVPPHLVSRGSGELAPTPSIGYR